MEETSQDHSDLMATWQMEEKHGSQPQSGVPEQALQEAQPAAA